MALEILYDPMAIGKQGQTVPFDCIEKTNGKRRRVKAFAASAFLEIALSARSEHKSGPHQRPLSGQPVGCHVAGTLRVT